MSILCAGCWYVFFSKERTVKRQLEQSPAAQVFTVGTSTATFSDFDGNSVDLNQFLGKLLIVNSWASWSPVSANELLLLTEVARDYSANDVVVIAINRAEPKRTAEMFLDTLGLTDEVYLIIDSDDSYYKAVGGYAMPETVLYDKKGNAIVHKRGPVSAEELRLLLDNTLSQQE